MKSWAQDAFLRCPKVLSSLTRNPRPRLNTDTWTPALPLWPRNAECSDQGTSHFSNEVDGVWPWGKLPSWGSSRAGRGGSSQMLAWIPRSQQAYAGNMKGIIFLSQVQEYFSLPKPKLWCCWAGLFPQNWQEAAGCSGELRLGQHERHSPDPTRASAHRCPNIATRPAWPKRGGTAPATLPWMKGAHVWKRHGRGKWLSLCQLCPFLPSQYHPTANCQSSWLQVLSDQTP